MNSSRKINLSKKLADSPPLNQETPPTFLILDRPPSTPPVPVRADGPFVPRTQIPKIPGYDVVDTLGRGGMGIIFKAHQRGLNRLVALKLILTGEQAGNQEVARFFQEAEAVGSLHHPNIVQIYEVGEHEGRHYLALEYVDGGTLAQRIRDRPQSPAFAANIIETIARAVDAVHSINIIHRDLKPANILLQANGKDSLPIAKIADFGLAKRLDKDHHLTETGWLAGTPTYMSPEQIRGDRDTIGPASDIWAIGVILYEMLTGRPPFQADCTAKTMAEVLNVKPENPSRLIRGIPRDLETICLKCLEKEPSHRYASGLALAEDLQRFREGRPISARRINAAEQVWRWCYRNRLVAGLLACILIVLMVGTTVSTLYALQANENARQANSLKATAESNAEESRLKTEEALQATEAANKARLEEARQKEIANELFWKARKREEKGLLERYALDANLSMLAWQTQDTRPLKKFIDRYTPKIADERDLRGFEWYYLNRLYRPEMETIELGQGSQGSTLFWGGDGIAYGQGSNVCFVAPNRIARPVIRPGHTGSVIALATNAKTGEIASAGLDGTVRTWNPDVPIMKQTLRSPKAEELYGVTYTPDGKTLIAWGGKHSGEMKPGEISLWDVETGKLKYSLQKHESAVESVAISGDGTRLVSCGYDGMVNVHELPTGKYLRSWTLRESLVSVAIDPVNKKWIALGKSDGTIAMIDVESGVLLRELYGHRDHITTLLPSWDGKLLASASWDRTVKIWDPLSGRMIRNIRAHDGIITSLNFKSNYSHLVSVGLEGFAKVWNITANPEYREFGTQHADTQSIMLPEASDELLSIDQYGMAYFWNIKDAYQRSQHAYSFPQNLILEATLFPDGDTLALQGWDNAIEYHSLRGKKLPLPLSQMKKGSHLAASPDKCWLAIVREWRRVEIQDLNQPYKPNTFALVAPATALAFAKGEDPLLAVAHEGSEIVLLRPDGKPAGTIKIGEGRKLENLAFSPDGKSLAGSSGIKDLFRVHLWDIKSGQELWSSEAHHRAIESISFSPRGDRILTASADDTIKLLEVTTGQETLTLRGHSRGFKQAMFSQDGASIISLGIDSKITRWDGGPTRPIPIPE